MVSSVALQSDGKILMGGAFTGINGVERNRVARLNSDGSVDDTFRPGKGPNATVTKLAVQKNGQIVVGGDFAAVSDFPRNRIARLNADGSLDTTFDPGAGFNDTVLALAIQPDGKMVAAGKFTSVNGV